MDNQIVAIYCACDDLLKQLRHHEDPQCEMSDTEVMTSTRPVPPWIEYLQFHGRKMVETTGSLIIRLFPKSIHAVTPQGFELKVFLFVLAYSLNCAL